MSNIIETESADGTAVWIKEEPLDDYEEDDDRKPRLKEEDALDITDSTCSNCGLTCSTLSELQEHISAEHASKTDDCFKVEEPPDNDTSKEMSEGSEAVLPPAADLVTCVITSPENKSDEKPSEDTKKCSIPYLTQKLPSNKNKKALALEKLAAAKADASKRFTCPHCSFRTEMSETLAEHIVEKHNKEPSFKCPLCEFNAGNFADVDQHMLVAHTNERPYACQYCDFSSKLTSTLKQHIAAVHSEVERQQCPYCDYSTMLLSNLRTHVQSKHSGEKKFVCPHCKYGTMTSTRLKNHIMAKHTKEKPLSCPYCPYSAIQTSNLKNHIISKHGAMAGAQ